MINVAICDDNEIEGREVYNTVEKFFLGIKENYNISVFSSGKALWYEFDDGIKFDILLLDIEMPEMDGMELTRVIKEKNSEALIIFVTSYEKYVLESFKVQPYRFIPKDKMSQMLPEALSDALKYISRQEGKVYSAKNQQGVEKVKIKDILYIWHAGKYAYIEKVNNENVKVRKTLKEIFEELPKDDFVWIERGCICNIAHIEKISNDNVFFSNGDIRQIGREKIKETKEKLQQYIMEMD